LALLSVTKVEVPGVKGLGEKVMVVPAGTPAVAVNIMGVIKPPEVVVAKLAAIVAGEGHPAVAVAPAVKAKSEGGTHPKEVVKLILKPPVANTEFILTDWPVVNINIQASFV